MIGVIALIVFGPRKLPEMMRTIGKTVGEFRRTTDDFKRTWQKEVDFEISELQLSENSNLHSDNQSKAENSIGRNSNQETRTFATPEIREISQSDFSINIPEKESPVVDQTKSETNTTDKRNWL